MSNIISHDFGRSRREDPSKGERHEVKAVCIYGEEAGYRVGLVEDAGGPEGLVLKVFVGEIGSDEVEAVAVVPSTQAGRIDADAIGAAICRTLEIVAGTGDGPGEA
jgi:hypothetical protein